MILLIGTRKGAFYRTSDGTRRSWKLSAPLFLGHIGHRRMLVQLRWAWTEGDQDGTPDGLKLHSVNIDPRDSNHLYVGMSSGGVFESIDRGASWSLLNNGCPADFLPIPDPEYGHDPHCLRLHPPKPDLLYQQNLCGIY